MILVVIYNLTKKDIKSAALLLIIEKTISDAIVASPGIRYYQRSDISKEIIFSFPNDPSVTTDDIPIAVTVDGIHLINHKRNLEFEPNPYQIAASMIYEAFRCINRYEKRPIQVIVRDPLTDGHYP